jgi:hypothetical protein
MSVRLLLVTASAVPSSPILVTLMMEALSSSETSVLTTATRRNIAQDAIVHSHRRVNLKSYNSSVIFLNEIMLNVLSEWISDIPVSGKSTRIEVIKFITIHACTK